MNSNTSPILSICIPTYNRSEYLKNTLDTIICQRRFIETNDVEIVISDNCSTDTTAEVGEQYHELFPSKIQYFRNDYNILDGNMEKSLRRGKGAFLKLNNDTLMHQDGSLDMMLAIINNNRDSRNILFFLNSGKKRTKYLICNNLDSFLDYVSYNCTWIGSFGIWKTDLSNMHDFSRYASLQLTQTDVLFRSIEKDRAVVVSDEEFLIVQEVQKKGGYDLVKVFLENYTLILKEALDNNAITSKTYIRETRKVLLNFFSHWFAKMKIYPEIFYFEKKDWKNKVYSAFKHRIICIILFYFKYVCYLCYFKVKKEFTGKFK